VVVVVAAAGGFGGASGSWVLLVTLLRVADGWRRRDVGLLLALRRVCHVSLLLVAHDRSCGKSAEKKTRMFSWNDERMPESRTRDA
jgi:hypothetical protein